MIKVHNRYPFEIHMYLDGSYLMTIPSMKYLTYNAIKEGYHVFTFTRAKKNKPSQVITEKEVYIDKFTEIYISP